MGEIFHGIPEQTALEFKHKFGLKYFVETGTLAGRTALWASMYFEKVYTVEIAYNQYLVALSVLQKSNNVELIYGQSQAVLEDLVPKLSSPALFWLDAHWSRDLGYPITDAAICPVLEEIEHIGTDEPNHVVMVDDFRLFGVEKGWPSKDNVKKALEAIGKDVSFLFDVFLAVPNGKT